MALTQKIIAVVESVFGLTPGGGGGSGTVTSITAGSGLSGGTITTSGTISLNLANPNSWTGQQTFGGTLSGASTTSNFLNVTGTLLGTGNSAANWGLNAQVTSAGSVAQTQGAMLVSLLAGYTGSSATYGAQFTNAAAGTNSVTTSISSGGNSAIDALSSGGGNYNRGVVGRASGGLTLNQGVVGIATSAQPVNIGVMGSALSATTANIPLLAMGGTGNASNFTTSASLVVFGGGNKIASFQGSVINTELVTISSIGEIANVVASATALTTAVSGTTYAFQVDTSTSSAATGLKVISGILGGAVTLQVLSANSFDGILFKSVGVGPFRFLPGADGVDIFQITRNDVTSVFQVDSSNIRVSIGPINPAATLHVLSTTEQLRLGNTSTQYTNCTVSSAGAVTWAVSAAAASTDGATWLLQGQAGTGSGNHNGGNLNFQPGAKANSGTDGLVQFLAGTGGGLVAQVNSNGLQAYRPINVQTGTTYGPVLTDAGIMVTLNNAGAITLTVPLNATIAFPINSEIDIAQLGAGQVTVAAAGGVTINSFGGKLALSGQYAGATLKKTGTDTWLLVGSLV